MALPSWVVLPRTRNDHNSKDGGNKETFFDKGFVLNVLLATHPPRQTLVVAVTLFTGLSPPVPSIPHRTTQTGRVWSACPTLLIDNDVGHIIRRIFPFPPPRPTVYPPRLLCLPNLIFLCNPSSQNPPFDIVDLPVFAVFQTLHPSLIPHAIHPAPLLHSLTSTTVLSYTNALVSFR